mgnify:CR=1 FL=1
MRTVDYWSELVSDSDENFNPDIQNLKIHLELLIEEGSVEVPMLPEVASRVLMIANDPDSDAAQLSKLIQGDQALAGHVMRIANSAAYTPNASMVSLQQAIARLGISLIVDISIAASLNTKLFSAPSYAPRLEGIWSHAVCAAIWGKEVARLSKKNVEASFLCGLLHSIGRPAILQVIHERSLDSGLSVSLDNALLLEDRYHVEFGKVIVEKWGMPSIVQESVQFYQDYQHAENFSDQAMVINAASKLADESLRPGDITLDTVFEDIVFADLNLYEDDLEQLKQQYEKVKAGMEAMRV